MTLTKNCGCFGSAMRGRNKSPDGRPSAWPAFPTSSLTGPAPSTAAAGGDVKSSTKQREAAHRRVVTSRQAVKRSGMTSSSGGLEQVTSLVLQSIGRWEHGGRRRCRSFNGGGKGCNQG